MRLTRRRVLLGAAGAVVARPAAALAADLSAPALTRLIQLEQDAAFAYRAAGGALMARIGEQENDHALALRGVLAGLGVASPDPPRAADALHSAATRLATDGTATAAIALERSLLDAHRSALSAFKEPGMLRTVATIMASHGQHLTVLYERSGRDPIHAGR